MTKLGFVMRGKVDNNRPLSKRRKIRASSASVAIRKTIISTVDNDVEFLRRVSVNTHAGRVSATDLVLFSNRRLKSSVPMIKQISAERSGELSFRMLNSLEDRMKEEEFDAFE